MKRQPFNVAHRYSLSEAIPQLGAFAVCVGPAAPQWMEEAVRCIRRQLPIFPLVEQATDSPLPGGALPHWALAATLLVALAKPGCFILQWTPAPTPLSLAGFEPKDMEHEGKKVRVGPHDQYLAASLALLMYARDLSYGLLKPAGLDGRPYFPGNIVLGVEEGHPFRERIIGVYGSFDPGHPVYATLNEACDGLCDRVKGKRVAGATAH